jgi:hypothetical protein
MIYRCTDPYHRYWPKYGGVGVRVCAPWLDFVVFRRDMGRRPDGCVLARHDRAGDFTPDNCYWELRETTARRARSSTTLSYKGETLLLSEWSRRTGLPAQRIRMRIEALGWPVGQALGLEPMIPTSDRCDDALAASSGG